ncbi:MAG: hypothetical protein DRJ98_01040 [Thermoprotei archaeon]|mgnify:CR=1 FL=1|nr:MAG: hypothetical protein DRJ98_01040 [Thermoprotei archaeon]RLF18653.1 MAG: hypothetical protein DRN06_00865 [Thermoprotei archaeon]
MIEEAGLIATYVTMGLTPIIYNMLTARKALKKKNLEEKELNKDKEEEQPINLNGEEAVKGFTLTVPCSITLIHSNDYGQAIHLSVKSIHPLPLSHVKRVLHQG